MERNTNRTNLICLECDKPAVYIRSTQFAGDHPYCEEHAKQESDFQQNDSYAVWDNWKPNRDLR